MGFVTAFFSTAPAKRPFNRVAYWVQRVTGTVLIMLGIRLAIARATHQGPIPYTTWWNALHIYVHSADICEKFLKMLFQGLYKV